MKKYITLLTLCLACVFFNQPMHADQTVFIFIGPPAAGKGVLCKKLSRETRLPHVSTGDLLRQAQADKNSPLAIQVSEYMKEGQLVPDEMIVQVLMHRIADEDCKNGFILDGFPRTLNQAKVLDKSLAGQYDLVVINLKVDEEVSVKRLLGRRTCASCTQPYHVEFLPTKKEGLCDLCGGKLVQRDDDSITAIQNRLALFKQTFEPIKAYYKNTHCWIELNAESAVDQTYANLLNQIHAITVDNLVLSAED